MHRAEPWAVVRVPISEIFLQGILASAAKEVPVLVSALVFLLKTSSVVLHLAAPPARGGLLSVYVTKTLPKSITIPLSSLPFRATPASSPDGQAVQVQLERLASEPRSGYFPASRFLGVS